MSATNKRCHEGWEQHVRNVRGRADAWQRMLRTATMPGEVTLDLGVPGAPNEETLKRRNPEVAGQAAVARMAEQRRVRHDAEAADLHLAVNQGAREYVAVAGSAIEATLAAWALVAPGHLPADMLQPSQPNDAEELALLAMLQGARWSRQDGIVLLPPGPSHLRLRTHVLGLYQEVGLDADDLRRAADAHVRLSDPAAPECRRRLLRELEQLAAQG